MVPLIFIEIKDLYVGERRAECVMYNLAHAIKPQLWYDGLVSKTAITSIQGCRFKFQRRKY